MQTISIVEAKSHLSEVVMKSAYKNKRFIITKRNKPVAALVSLEDLAIIEQHHEKAGLIDIAGKWNHFEEVAKSLENLSELRAVQGNGRDVSF